MPRISEEMFAKCWCAVSTPSIKRNKLIRQTTPGEPPESKPVHRCTPDPLLGILPSPKSVEALRGGVKTSHFLVHAPFNELPIS